MLNLEEKKIAFVPFGEINSPKELIVEMSNKALSEIHGMGFPVVSVDVVTDDEHGEDVKRASGELNSQKFDVLVVCLAGWIPSHAVVSITDQYRHLPIILWGLAGEKTGTHIVTTAAQAGTSALRKVFADLGYRFLYVYNIIGKESPLARMKSFVNAAFATKQLRAQKIGMMGFRDMRLYNTLYDGVSLKNKLGIEVEFFEMLEVVQLSQAVDHEEIETLLLKVKQNWTFLGEVNQEFLKQGVAYYLAIKKIVDARDLHAISLKDVDGMKKILSYPPAFIFMLLADEAGLCTIPENDVMGAVTQLVVQQATGQIGCYLEFYEYFEDSVLMGVPDYVPAEVVKDEVKVTPAAFGQISGGLLNVSAMREGELTLARLSNTGSSYTMHIARGNGEFCAWEEAGWTQPAPQLPSLRISLTTPIPEFVDHISGQHYIIAYGNHTTVLKDFCMLNSIHTVIH